MSADASIVLFEKKGPVAWMTFNRPDKRNATTPATYERIMELLDEVEGDPAIRALVLTGSGDKDFVNGTDRALSKTFTDPQRALDYEARVDGVIGRLEALACPTIAAINGNAVGEGLTIALACDVRYCVPQAVFGIRIARTLGNCLSINNYARFVDLIGAARTKELIFTGTLIEAAEAKAIGLVNGVFEEDGFAAKIDEIAGQIAGNAPLTIQVTKEAVRQVLAHRRPADFEDLPRKAYLSEDFQEGVRFVAEGRAPKWSGR
jgi:enoyl-CoA hydratase/carnithine racemase